MICEYCKNDHDGSYGSGRFCSSKCARAFSTYKKRKEINKKVSSTLKGYRTVPGGKIKLCDYGCGQEAQFQLKNRKWCCKNSFNKCPYIREKNSKGLKKSHNNGRANFPTGALEKSHISRRKNLKEKYKNLSFKELPISEKRRIILKEQQNKCSICGITSWNNKSLVLQLDHIDGNNKNEKKENLRLICPNCHSQTNTFCGKNIKNVKQKITDIELLTILKNSENIHQVLQKANLTPKGRNYKRVYKLVVNNTLDLKK